MIKISHYSFRSYYIELLFEDSRLTEALGVTQPTGANCSHVRKGRVTIGSGGEPGTNRSRFLAFFTNGPDRLDSREGVQAFEIGQSGAAPFGKAFSLFFFLSVLGIFNCRDVK